MHNYFAAASFRLPFWEKTRMHQSDIMENKNLSLKYWIKRLKEDKALKERVYRIIFKADTPAGKRFDIALLIVICFSILLIFAESVFRFEAIWGSTFYVLEWLITVLFTIEYAARLYAVNDKKKYALSFFGIIDALAILPFYLEIILPSFHFLAVIRVLRLLRVFRILHLVRFLVEGDALLISIWRSRRKIMLFLLFEFMLSMILGSVMYIAESPKNPGFNNIPQAIYWAIVTLTTVGYGDVSPITAIGKMIASITMMLGYAIIAVPTGIVTSQIVRSKYESARKCAHCKSRILDEEALYCKYCGSEL